MTPDTNNSWLLRNTVYAVAWGMIPMNTVHRRVWAKRRCMAYARTKGLNLHLWGHAGTIEDWILETTPDFKKIVARGTLQQCCLHIVTMELPTDEQILALRPKDYPRSNRDAIVQAWQETGLQPPPDLATP